MADAGLYTTFLAAAFVLVIIPGPDMLLIMALGTRHGSAAGFTAALGVAVGLSVHIGAVVLGLTALLRYEPAVYVLLRWAGAAYLVYLAVSAFLARGIIADEAPTDGSAAPANGHRLRCFRRAVITNMLNPKVIVFNSAFLPQFVDPARGDIGLQLVVLGVTLVLVDLLIDGTVGLTAGRIGQLLRKPRLARTLSLGCGAIFIALAVDLIVDR
jgi:threonine/homoserine/homoserine lactone efflux protein